MTIAEAAIRPGISSGAIRRPLLLDLFCGAGGCSTGYHRTGFEVVGVDIKSQPRYPLHFIQADALEFLAAHGREFDVIHASPPCQRYSVAANIHRSADRHPDLVGPIRNLLIATGRPWVIENVLGSPLQYAVMVCGLGVGCRVRRHRWFESNVLLFGSGCGNHKSNYVIVFGGGAKGRGRMIGKAKGGDPMIRRPFVPHSVASAAMGIDWMTRAELSQAIPPAYTEFIGWQLMRTLQ